MPEVVEEVVVASVDVAAARAWLVAHAVPGVDEVVALDGGATVHRRLVPTSRGATLLEIGLGGQVVLRAVQAGAPEEALALGRRWLGLDTEPAPGVAALADDPVLGPLVTARPLVRVPGTTDAFETAVNVVLGQHVSVAAGRVFAGRVASAHGGAGQDSRLMTYPTPETLASLDPDELRATVGVTGARARTVVAIARAVLDGLDLSPATDAGRRADTRRALLALPGVGPWTADLVGLRCLRDPDVFLPGDLVLRKAMGGVSAREAADRAEAWAPHRSLAVVHLWTHHALDPG